MAALTSGRRVETRKGSERSFPVAANTVIYDGAVVVLAGGYARPATYATPSLVVGVARQSIDNTGGAAGAKRIEVETGVFAVENSAAPNAVDLTMVGTAVLFMDDQTVAKTGTSGGVAHTGSTVFDVNAKGVWLKV